MSRDLQHRVWSMKPENRALMAKVATAHFFHHTPYSGGGLTYQSCRFCKAANYEKEEREHVANCWFIKNTGEVCRGLWRYSVRHYICSECRKSVLLGLAPRKQKPNTGVVADPTIKGPGVRRGERDGNGIEDV